MREPVLVVKESRTEDQGAQVSRQVPVSVSLVLPAYNEAANVVAVVEGAITFLRAQVERFEIVVVNDGSTDQTGELAEELSRRYPEVSVVHPPVNQGYGASLRDGFTASRYEWLFFTDADHQFRIDSLSELLPLRDQAEIIVGFRRERQDPWSRRVLSLGYNALMGVIFDVRVRDIDCAFKLFHRRVFESVRIESDRFFVNTELLVKARARRFRIVETGVDHFPRQYDRSKVSVWEIPRTLREIMRIWRSVRSTRGHAGH